jgi:hypothetical protein
MRGPASSALQLGVTNDIVQFALPKTTKVLNRRGVVHRQQSEFHT